MQTCNSQLLSAYVDGELPADRRMELQSHVATCQRCKQELVELMALSRQFRQYPFEDLNSDEAGRAMDAVDEAQAAPIWRLGGAMGLIAASILVISGVWMMTLQDASSPTGSTGLGSMAYSRDSWERTAITLQADPVGPAIAPNGSALTFDERLDEFMLETLKKKSER